MAVPVGLFIMFSRADHIAPHSHDSLEPICHTQHHDKSILAKPRVVFLQASLAQLSLRPSALCHVRAACQELNLSHLTRIASKAFLDGCRF